MRISFIIFFFITITQYAALGQEHTTARQWNEILLEAIRNDYARPTVHARNLFHSSVLMYDCWAVYDDTATPFFLGNTVGGYTCPFEGLAVEGDPKSNQEMAMSYAVYRLLKHRFGNSIGAEVMLPRFDSLFVLMGYDTTFTSTDYQSGNPAALGNYIAEKMIDFGHQDNSNEQADYVNRYYRSFNFPLAPTTDVNPFLWDPNRWQPLTFDVFIDQAGNEVPGGSPEFLSPEWGLVTPFSLTEAEKTVYSREGNDYWVYLDPGTPPLMDPDSGKGTSDLYRWNFAMVAVWSSHLDPADGVMWDISPATLGNVPISDFPKTFSEHEEFYDFFEGGDIGQGHAVNPVTGQPYPPQVVPRADYARVLAEFWADGPDSETPPGHWFTILNYVNDHPQLVKKFEGEGEVLDDLEWDVKSYLLLGGAMHDAAIAAWGVKGWYDYVRPISAIRYMADNGQSTDPALPNYHVAGLPLIDGFIEVVQPDDPLAIEDEDNIGKIKLYGWRGPDYIEDPDTSVAGVGWIMASTWWPYQRPTFVTPPFAGYVSGHSTYSRAAAEVLTRFTGDPFFPGGVGEFLAEKDSFLVFEDGPSQDIVLQWATYRDASDQTSLSRIWGGIHPPADDIPGRFIGEKVGNMAYDYGIQFFNEMSTSVNDWEDRELPLTIFPNPAKKGELLTIKGAFGEREATVSLMDITGKVLDEKEVNAFNNTIQVGFVRPDIVSGIHLLRVVTDDKVFTTKLIMQ